MIKIKEDLTNKKYGKLTVIKRAEDKTFKNEKPRAAWFCKCDCGNPELKIVTSHDLKSGHTKSCGCLSRENALKNIEYIISNDLIKHSVPNKYDLSKNYGIGYTNDNKEFYFDLEDYELIKNIHWTIDKNGYVCGHTKEGGIRMHRLVMNVTDKNIYVDHIYHRKNDNRKSQLRLCNNTENTRNCIPGKNNKSGVVGVYWDKLREKWASTIKVNNKSIYLGRYINKDDAINARRNAELKYFGEYSYLLCSDNKSTIN